MPFRTAITGLNAAQTDLKVIGNNVANSATTGFKASRTEFKDLYPSGQSGGVGVNASNAAGNGVRVSTVRQQFDQGNIAFTNSAMDLAVNGAGFFRINTGQGFVYTRQGAFGVDKDGFVVNSDGGRLTGFMAEDGVVTGVLGDLQVSRADNPPRATNEVEVVGNVDAGVEPKGVGDPPLAMGAEIFDDAGNPFAPQRFAPPDPGSYHNSTSLQVYDSLGEAHNATLYFRKEADNDWTVEMSVDNGAFIAPAEGTNVTFDNQGNITAPAGPPLGVLNYAGIPVDSGAADMAFSFDMSEISQFGSSFGINALEQDGYSTGRLSALEFDNDGQLLAKFTNGSIEALGQVALANFSNPEGLQQLGDTMWAESARSGEVLLGAPSTGTLGFVQSSALEDSTVELTQELVKLIVAQRNFQANAQVIRAADELQQTVVNLR